MSHETLPLFCFLLFFFRPLVGRRRDTRERNEVKEEEKPSRVRRSRSRSRVLLEGVGSTRTRAYTTWYRWWTLPPLLPSASSSRFYLNYRFYRHATLANRSLATRLMHERALNLATATTTTTNVGFDRAPVVATAAVMVVIVIAVVVVVVTLVAEIVVVVIAW